MSPSVFTAMPVEWGRIALFEARGGATCKVKVLSEWEARQIAVELLDALDRASKPAPAMPGTGAPD